MNALYILRIYLSKEKSHEKHHPSNVVCALIEIFFEILLHQYYNNEVKNYRWATMIQILCYIYFTNRKKTTPQCDY